MVVRFITTYVISAYRH